MIKFKIAELVKADNKYDITLFEKNRIDNFESNIIEKMANLTLNVLLEIEK